MHMGIIGLCLSFDLVLSLVIKDKYQLRYELFCRHTPILKSAMGYRGNHAFSHSPYQNTFEDNLISHSGGPS